MLKANRRLFVFLFIFQADTNINRLNKFGYFSIGVITFIFSVLAALASIAFVHRSIDTDLFKESYILCIIYAILQIAGYGSAAYMMLFAFVLKKDISNLLNLFEKFFKINVINRFI